MNEIDAGSEFLRRLNQFRHVRAAYWLRGAEDGERYLHVALEGLTDQNIDVAYGEVLRIASEMKDHYIDPFPVKILRVEEPVVQAVVDIYRRFPGRIPTRFNGPVLGGVPVAEVYIYPQFAAKP